MIKLLIYHIFDLKKSKESFYYQIYYLKIMKIKMLKVYIKIKLANNLIKFLK